MKRIRTRIGSILLSMALILTLLPVTALAEGNVAKIGNQEYPTLENAIEHSTSGDIITLLTDIVNTDGAAINYSLKAGTTLDGDGRTIKGAIGVYIPADGATVKNVKFVDIHNEGNTQSAVYASGLTGTATITGCTFDNADWDAIQITPTATSAKIVITNNVFRHTNITDTQLRYVHVEHTGRLNGGSKIAELTVTDNQFFSTENSNDEIISIDIWYVKNTTTTLNISGNYVENQDTATVGYNLIKNDLYPMRSKPNVDVDDIMPVAYNASDVFFTIQDAVNAVDQDEKYVRLKADSTQEAVIPEGKEITFYSYGHSMGTLTNNGTLTIGGSELAGTSQIINNGTLTLSGDSATVYDIVNNGTLKINSGTTYNLSKITGSGSITITGGTFSTRPDAALMNDWYIVKEQSGDPATYKVSRMKVSEAVEAGAVAASGDSTTATTFNYYRSVTEGVNNAERANTYLHKDITENVTVSTLWDKSSGVRVLNSNGYTFTGSLTINDGCGSVRLYGKGTADKFTLTNVTGELLYVGGNTSTANATIQNAQLETLDVVGKGVCTVEGGQYGSVVLGIYRKSSTTNIPTLSITGGSFASGTVTVKYSDSAPSETAPLSDYVADGYMVVTGTGAYPYQVVKAGNNAATVVPGEADVSVAENITGEDEKELAESVTTALTNSSESGSAEPSISADVLGAAAGTVANQNTVTADTTVEDGKTVQEALDALDESTTVSDEDITIVVQPYLDIKVTDVSIEGETKTVTLDITPMYITVATTADLASDGDIILAADNSTDANAIQVGKARELTISKPVEVTLSLPKDFAADGPLYIKHEKTPGTVYYYTGSVEDNVLTFTNPHGFSKFTLMSTNDAKAEIGDVGYPSLQAAVNDVTSGGTIKVLGSDTQSAVVSREVTFKLEGAATITAGSGYQLTQNGDTYTITRLPETSDGSSGSSGGSGSSDDGDYSVSVPSGTSVEGGSISVSPRSADKGDTVTITVKPDAGYVLDELTVTARSGGAVALTRKNDSQYTFRMPGSSVVIDVSFVEEGTAAAEEMAFIDVAESFWAYSEIRWAYDNGYMNGTSATTFNPNGTVNRQQVWMILARMAGASPANMAAAKAWAVENGISDGTNPTGAVTRQQLVALLYRFASQNGYNVSNKADLSSYPDAASVASYAAEPMAWAVANGIIGGTTAGTLNAAGNSNRAQLAVILWRFYQTTAG